VRFSPLFHTCLLEVPVTGCYGQGLRAVIALISLTWGFPTLPWAQEPYLSPAQGPSSLCERCHSSAGLCACPIPTAVPGAGAASARLGPAEPWLLQALAACAQVRLQLLVFPLGNNCLVRRALTVIQLWC